VPIFAKPSSVSWYLYSLIWILVSESGTHCGFSKLDPRGFIGGFNGLGIAFAGQRKGLHPRKSEVRIFDYVDRDLATLLRMFEKRLRGYRAIGYARGEAPLGYGESDDEVVIEYDQDVLRSLEDPADLT
jgi:hypothetical protein